MNNKYKKSILFNTKNQKFIKNVLNTQVYQNDIKQIAHVNIKQKNYPIIIKDTRINSINQNDRSLLKQPGINQKEKDNGIIKDTRINGINQKNLSLLKQPGINQKENDNGIIKDTRINGINQKNLSLLKQPGINQKNLSLVNQPGINQKNLSLVNQMESSFNKKNILQQKKNFGLGLKGDMDGLGKEKGNYTPKFVYLYKQKFEMEAVKNKNDMNGLSPLSKYEPTYNPNYWNNNKNIKNNNNCYSYSVNNKNHQFGKPQPGYFARFNHIQNNQYKCAYFFKRILNDIPSVYLTSFKQKCKKGFHKAFFAIDSNKNEHDYHFYRQDTNQLWSHKPGTTNVINYDADYKIIKNPLKANRNYSAYNYDKPCFFFCVNNKFGKTKAKN